ncbi:Gfo/Idh/MocA family oxidoreductase [Hyunsoonleella sp. SJ7]|uniref:Gfo/Idh/MocA family oxidoreductase n=1 Tax=Hyunsoonleella aquatilis TaxID=2762758 RepID=A0A923KFT3_9FLAO|nr:Gfo/Idh/MocA family oxidoreductase [Hyunsoonleella aquatilis]MBC3756771.1 Gfo/Idh/MocA family oxidoreductase [Hyunsoonleella aquatilis]
MATIGLTSGLLSSAMSMTSVMGANEKIRMGFIGLGNRGTLLLNWFMENPDVEVAALCDVYEPYTLRDRSKVAERYLEIGKVPKMGEAFGSKVKRYTDFRKLLEQKDIDAVCIATPDHWHAIQTIAALEAGKHVYVEKPLTITIQEGRAMVNAHKKSGKVCAVGLNRRGSSIYQHLAKEVQSGIIGKVTTARAQRTSNMYPNGIGMLQPEEPPKDFDWDMWLGPRAFRPYQYNIAPYFFRWWKEYSSQMGNWGVHFMDVIRWMLNEQAPVAITATGGKFAVQDDRNIPDTMEVLFEMPSKSIIKFSIHEASGGGAISGGEVELHGAKGNLIADQNGYSISSAQPGQFQTWNTLVEPVEKKLEGGAEFGDMGSKENSTGNLIRNFLDCIKDGGEPLCSLEEGHRSTSFAHLANISLELGQRIEWDAVNERITNSEKANEYLHYEYRAPWRL